MPTMTINVNVNMTPDDLHTHCTRFGHHWFADEDIRYGRPVEDASPIARWSGEAGRRRETTMEERMWRAFHMAKGGKVSVNFDDLMSIYRSEGPLPEVPHTPPEAVVQQRERIIGVLHQALVNECAKRGGTAAMGADGLIRVDTTIDPGLIVDALLMLRPS